MIGNPQQISLKGSNERGWHWGIQHAWRKAKWI